MNPALATLRRTAGRRRVAITLATVAPPALAMSVLVARQAGAGAASAAAVLAVALAAALAWRAWRGVDAAWLARRLDALAPQMDDSAALLFHDTTTLSPLQRLQQSRLHARLAGFGGDLRPAWPWRPLAASAGIAAVILAFALGDAARPPSDANPAAATTPSTTATALTRTELLIEAPAYTQIAPRRDTALDAKAPEGAHLHWRLRFDPQPTAASLQFHDGQRVALVRDGDAWRGDYVLTASTLYRLVLDGAPPPAEERLFRLDALPDRAPEVRVLQPDKTLSLLDAGQKNWALEFEASDDFGLARAELAVTLAQGSGENIAFREHTLTLVGEPIGADRAAGNASRPREDAAAASLTSRPAEPAIAGTPMGARRMRYRHSLDLAALGIAQGDDVIVRLAVTDNREPQPNTTRSASFILRWPAEPSSESAGLEGIVQKTMPAYFRSQRQIIIDSEALLAERAALDEEKFLSRSDAIGVDQKILRLRYGQFLGEESEGHGGGHGDAGDAAHDDHADDAQHAETPAPARFGDAGNALAEYGHVHDIAEAATLLDPDTKAILKSALGEMWQAELHLRQGHPDLALPYEHRALEFIKQVQQSTRIYLARVGLELPPPDEARRLSGERTDLADRVGSLAAATDDERAIAHLWQALADGGTPDWSAAATWLRANQARLPDALGVLAALDTAQRDPACADCRARLRDRLWPLLPTPAAATAPRAAPDAAGGAYLDALREAAKEVE